MIKIDVSGLKSLEKRLSGMSKQVNFATAKTLTQVAYAGRDDVKKELRTGIKGGATAFTLRAFNVEPAKKETLESSVYLRKDSPEGGTSYSKALAHLFSGGNRNWKKLEGWMRGKGIIPPGMMVAPGPKAPLDARGNFSRRHLSEMIGILSSQLTNLRVYRKSGRGKLTKAIGFFVALPGDKSGLTPGVWRRIDTGFKSDASRSKHSSSVVELWLVFIRPASYRQQFDLKKIVQTTVDREFNTRFGANLANALGSAR